MAANSGRIDFVQPSPDLEIPSCDHGPALLFRSYDSKSSSGRQFFACSAFRDKKVCPFFQWADEPQKWMKHSDKTRSSLTHKEWRKRFKQFIKMKKEDRVLCVDCGLLLLEDEVTKHEGKGHKLHKGISRADLSSPTKLFAPLDNNKTYAQYLFTDKAVEFILSSLQRLSVTHVVCIGCPRVHEHITNLVKDQCEGKLTSLLLDLDHRYMYAPSQYLRFNMLNQHFFGGEKDREIFETFISETDNKRVAIVTDPPFGIMVEAFALTLSRIKDTWSTINSGKRDVLPVMWFFPYFMEKRVVEHCPGYTMLDYKVDYDNHSLFKKDHGRKKGSPVRIFTNINPKLVPMPAEEGYWFCSPCGKYTSAENKHCAICKSCTTKDGPTYRHCEQCERCVKPSRVHCGTCGHCDLQDHVCGERKQSTGCHICGEEGHKRRECPNKGGVTQQGLRGNKRKIDGHFQKRKKQKK